MVAGCQRGAQRGRAVCPEHRRTAEGKEAEAAVRRVAAAMARDAGEIERERAMAAFRQRVEQGDYGALFDEQMHKILGQAGNALGYWHELGAVRFALAKLLAEEPDAHRLALGVSRLVTTSMRVARTKEGIGRRDACSDRDSWEAMVEMAEQMATEKLRSMGGWGATRDGVDGAWEEGRDLPGD